MTNGKASRDAILAAAHLKTIEVDVPVLGGLITLREMGAAERDILDEHMRNAPAEFRTRGFRALMIMLSVVDSTGERMFADSDLPKLNMLPGEAASSLAAKIADLSLVTQKAVEDEAKNSEGARIESSSSASPERSEDQA